MRSLITDLCFVLVLVLAVLSVGCTTMRTITQPLFTTTPDDDQKTIAKGIAEVYVAPSGVQPLSVIVSAEQAKDLGNERAIAVVDACTEHLKDAAVHSGWFDVHPASSVEDSAPPEGVQHRLSLRVNAFELQPVDDSNWNVMLKDTASANEKTQIAGIETNLAIRLEEYRNGHWILVASANGGHETGLLSGDLTASDLGGLGAPTGSTVTYNKEARELSRTEVRNNLHVAVIIGVENLVRQPRVQAMVRGPVAAHP